MASHKCLRILFADDERSLQEVMRSELPRLGHEVVVCPDGKAALKALEKSTFDAAILDIRMPGLTGIEVLEQLKQISPDTEVVEAFDDAGGEGKPRYAQVTVCWAESEKDARKTALEWWPNAALQGPLSQELALPSYFEAASAMVDEEAIAQAIVCGPDPEAHAKAIDTYVDAGFTHVYVHQVGPDQEGFLRFYESEILPRYARVHAAAR